MAIFMFISNEKKEKIIMTNEYFPYIITNQQFENPYLQEIYIYQVQPHEKIGI